MKQVGTSKVTKNGRVSLNKGLLDLMGLKEGDYVIFYKVNGRIILVPAEIKPKGG